MTLNDSIALVKALEGGEYQKLCPNRIWNVWQAWTPPDGNQDDGIHTMLPLLADFKNILREDFTHEDHTACSFNFCEFSSRNFTAVKQYHEPWPNEDDDQSKVAIDHEQNEHCFTLRGLFNNMKLSAAIKAGKPTAWNLDGSAILEHPRPFMAISHVWSDGTGSGTWPSNQVNECLYTYFKEIAKSFHCEGIWWDTICMPQDRMLRSQALNIMHLNYEYARVTVVHDRFLRRIPFRNRELASFAIVMSPWFTRGWTALELAQSQKVKVIFQDSIKDLDKDILSNTKGNIAASMIRKLRAKISKLEDLLTILRPRYTSWLKDRAAIAGILTRVPITDSDRDTFQRQTYQKVLKKIKKISHGHLFHKSVTMAGDFDWCATSLFELPRADDIAELEVCENGDLIGEWLPFSIEKQGSCFDTDNVFIFQGEWVCTIFSRCIFRSLILFCQITHHRGSQADILCLGLFT